MKKHARKPNKVDFRIPGDLTETLVARLMSLPGSVKTDYMKKHLMSQYVGPNTDSASIRRTRAINKWLAAERDNEATNVRILMTPGQYNILPRITYDYFVGQCRDLITRIIGDVPPVRSLIGSFSGGASTSRPRTVSHPATKYVGKAHVTDRAKDWFLLLQDELPLWLGREGPLEMVTQPGNVLFTVPKKTDIDRVACKEPDLNMFIQKGIGNFIRRRLLRVGINLNEQANNRSLAHRGSVTDQLSTLDLSSASDSVTRELVFTMLPVNWFTLLDSVRSPVTIIDGEEHPNEMFSSMGNGFTFELESLLFYAISEVTARLRNAPGVVSVYGDDIICPSEIAYELSSVLGWFGFQINTEKSCYSGPLRESCGGHYYSGIDITPFYIKAPIVECEDLIDVSNKIRQWAQFVPYDRSRKDIDPAHLILNPEVEDLWFWLKSYVPRCLWGGVDTSFKYQLASHDAPHSRLSEETRSRGTGLGGYLHWHNAVWDRDRFFETVSTSRRTESLGKVRVKRARRSTVDRLPFYFYNEVVKTSD